MARQISYILGRLGLKTISAIARHVGQLVEGKDEGNFNNFVLGRLIL